MTKQNRSESATCPELSELADNNAIRELSNEQFDVADLWEKETQPNQALAHHIPDKMPRGDLEIVINFHDDPFYSKFAKLRSYTMRNYTKKNTTRIYR